MFTALLFANAMSWALLGAVVRADFSSRERNPEVALGRRAWMANRRLASEVKTLGPLFQPIARRTRYCLRGVSRLEQEVARRAGGPGCAAPMAHTVYLLRSLSGAQDPEVLRLRNVVEQLEETASRLARYRAGLGGLRDLEVPLACLYAELQAELHAA